MLGAWTFGDFLWTSLVLSFSALLIWMFVSVFANILRRRDIGGWGKAGWIFLIVVLPLIGILIYVMARTSGALDVTMGRAAY